MKLFPINNLNKIYLIVFSVAFIAALNLYAQGIEIPKNLDAKKFSAGFRYRESGRAADGKKIQYVLNLSSTGVLNLKTLYYPLNNESCGYIGGRFSKPISSSDHKKSALLAIKALNENIDPENKRRRTREERTLSLFVELDTQMKHTSLHNFKAKNTILFRKRIADFSNTLVNNKENYLHVLKLETSLLGDKHQLQISLQNLGKIPFTLFLPKNPLEVFTFKQKQRSIFLSYAKNQNTGSFILEPNQPKTIFLKYEHKEMINEGILYYNNTRVKSFPAKGKVFHQPKVILCNKINQLEV